MASFLQYLESKKTPSITFSLEHYKETVERAVYDHLLSQNREFALTFLAEITNLRENLKIYPDRNQIFLALAARDPAKVKQVHEQFTSWAKNNDVDGSIVEAGLFESRSYLYGQEIVFSKETADKIVEFICSESLKNIQHIFETVNQGIKRIPWNDSEIIIKAIPIADLITNEAMIIVGQPPLAMTFMCKNLSPLEVFDIQDIEGYPYSTQKDYLALIEWLRQTPRLNFDTKYAIIPSEQRSIFENIKREIALGMEKILPQNTVLYENVPETDQDIWQIKFKNKIYNEEMPLRWLNLIKKANT